MTVSGPPNLAEYRLPSSQELSGRSFAADLQDGGRVELRFAKQTVQWTASGVSWAGDGTDRCDVVEMAPGVWFIDIDVAEPALDALTVVIDEPAGWLLAVHQRCHPERAASVPRVAAVKHTFATGWLEGSPQGQRLPHPTLDLVGRWHRYRYSPENLYEHIYVSADRLVAHNVDTQNTQGRADCHPVSYWWLGGDRYLVTWREFDSQMAAVSVEDLGRGRVTSKALHPISPDRSSNAPIGGYLLPVDVRFPDAEEKNP